METYSLHITMQRIVKTMVVTVWYVKKKKITNIFTLIVNITKNIGKR